jgi:hypothetical protein
MAPSTFLLSNDIDNLYILVYHIVDIEINFEVIIMNKVEKKLLNGMTVKCICLIAAVMLCCGVILGCDQTVDEPDTSTDTQEVTNGEPTDDVTESGTDETPTTPEEDTTTEETTDPNEPDAKPEDKDYYKNDTKLFNKSVMFSANEFEGEYNSVFFKNDGLMLVPGATEGTFVSNEVHLGGSFKNMLASWNSNSTGGTVEISVSVKLDDGSFTGWYSWGEWSAIRGISGSKSMEDQNGEVDIDILTLKKECQGIVKFKIHIKQTADESPIVYNVTLACDKKESNLKAPADTYKKLDVPYRRQMDVPEIGGSICSATSLSMVLLYHGEKITDIADVAWGVRDYGAGKFGNWAFNVAYAGELGYQTYIDYFDIDAIKYAVSTGHPMVCSIRVKAGQLAASGYPNYTTNGHLLCVVGYEEKNGQKWLLINDPAHPEVKAILESDFANIYRGVSYIVQLRPDHSIEE